jgi:hypothetical protein
LGPFGVILAAALACRRQPSRGHGSRFVGSCHCG